MNSQYIKPLSITSQFSFCGLPFRLDTYSGCGFDCKYCFAQKRGGNTNLSRIKVAVAQTIINKFKSALENKISSNGLISEFIRRKMPLHLGGMSDPFQQLEEKYRVTRDVLLYLKTIDYPLVISTKSSLISNDPYLEILCNYKNLIVQVSLSTLNEETCKIIEPNCPTPNERLRTLEILAMHNIKTSIRWQPYIPTISENPKDFIDNVASVGINHLTFEFLKIPIDNKKFWDDYPNPFNQIRALYKSSGGIIDGREIILPPKIKINTIWEVKKELKNYQISFGCAENDLQYLSDTECCCGVDKFCGFENWNKYQFSYAIRNSKDQLIQYDNIKNEWKPQGSIDQYLNSKSRIYKKDTHNKSADYLIERWENLKSDFNLIKYYNVIDSGTRDENGIRIYIKDDDYENTN